MYRKVLLAYDGSEEGRRALREGARVAQLAGAEVFLLAVVPAISALAAGLAATAGVPPSAAALSIDEPTAAAYDSVLAEGVSRLQRMGFATPAGRVTTGDPARQIEAVAHEIGADLVVIGYRRHNALTRWWQGTMANYLVEHLSCSILVGRLEVSDETFFALLEP